MTWSSFRDPRPAGASHGCAEFYRAHQQDAVVTFDVFRARVCRGWPMPKALTAPQVKQWGTARARVLLLIKGTPGISRRDLSMLMESASALSAALFRLEEDGHIRREETGRTSSLRYFPTATAPTPILTDLSAKAQPSRPYVNPIRARLLGLPIAETERTREVWGYDAPTERRIA